MGLYGYGDLDDYGSYTIVCAENIEEATEIIKKDEFSKFKELISEADTDKHIDKNGNAENGYGSMYLYCEKMGYYTMDDNSMFEAFCKNEFGKDLWMMEFSTEKKYSVVDLKTNVWRGENS